MRPATLRFALALLALAAAGHASAQVVHRAVGVKGRVTETLAFTDAWEDGGRGPQGDGLLDVLTRVEINGENEQRSTAHLLLFGEWGGHLYVFDEDRVTRGTPEPTDTTALRTAMKAVDLDADGLKEILLIERTLVTRLAVDDVGLPADEPGPFFRDATVRLRYLAREAAGALVEHELEPEAGSDAMKELLARELGGALNAWLQLAAADVDFAKERYELARYRYGVVREWAESQLTAREIDALSPARALPGATPDEPAALWLAATRRIGALPRWYQRR